MSVTLILRFRPVLLYSAGSGVVVVVLVDGSGDGVGSGVGSDVGEAVGEAVDTLSDSAVLAGAAVVLYCSITSSATQPHV